MGQIWKNAGFIYGLSGKMLGLSLVYGRRKKKLGLLVDHWIAVKTGHKNHRFCPFCFMGNTMVSGEDVPFNQVRFAIMFRVASYG